MVEQKYILEELYEEFFEKGMFQEGRDEEKLNGLVFILQRAGIELGYDFYYDKEKNQIVSDQVNKNMSLEVEDEQIDEIDIPELNNEVISILDYIKSINPKRKARNHEGWILKLLEVAKVYDFNERKNQSEIREYEGRVYFDLIRKRYFDDPEFKVMISPTELCEYVTNNIEFLQMETIDTAEKIRKLCIIKGKVSAIEFKEIQLDYDIDIEYELIDKDGSFNQWHAKIPSPFYRKLKDAENNSIEREDIKTKIKALNEK